MVALARKKQVGEAGEQRSESGQYEVSRDDVEPTGIEQADDDRDDDDRDDRATIPDLGPAGWGWEGAPLHDTIPAPPSPGVVCDDVLSAVDEMLSRSGSSDDP